MVAKQIKKRYPGREIGADQAEFVRPGETMATNTRPLNDLVPNLTEVPQRRHKWGEFEAIPQTAKGA